MASVIVTPTAEEDLVGIIAANNLPEDTWNRVKAVLSPLTDFPFMGTALSGERWEGSRFLLGPWRWMLLIYVVIEDEDLVAVTTIQDARRAEAATSDR